MKKTTFFILLMTVLLMILPMTALATTATVKYIDENGVEQSQTCIIMESGNDYTFEGGKWYAVTKDVTIKNRIENRIVDYVFQPAHLILADGYTLTAACGIYNDVDRELVIYGQSNGTGTLIADASNVSDNAGIGGYSTGSGGKVTINGGTVIAKGGLYGAGIGGGKGGHFDSITINGGTVTTEGMLAPGLGLGYEGRLIVTPNTIRVNGGTLTAIITRQPKIGSPIPAINPGSPYTSVADHLLILAGDNEDNAKQIDIGEINSNSYVRITSGKAYTVSHQLQKADGIGYELRETETLYGLSGFKTKAAAKSYDGFKAQEFSQETIASDGSTVVTIRYNRNIQTITFNANGLAANPKPIKAIWGSEINEPQTPETEGFQFEGWYKEKECINPFTFSTMPAENLTLYAKWAVDPSKRQNVQYIAEDGSTKEVSCIILSTDKDAYKFDTGEWYAVTGNVTVSSRILNNAPENSPAHLILKDGASLTVKGGIHNQSGNGLIIYSQENGTGSLSVSEVSRSNAGIGGGNKENGGMILINGGTVTAAGGQYGAGIGGGQDGEGGKITINDGTVTAAGGYEGAGIGGGLAGNGGKVTIKGGTVTATGGEWGAGIGAGRHKSEGTLVFDSDPIILKAGSDKSSSADVDIDIYKTNHQNYPYVYLKFGTGAKADYTVQHKLQKALFSDEYEVKETETKTGYVGADTKAAAKDYPGYIALDITQKVITADIPVIVEVKYNLIYNTITFDANGHGTAPEPIYAASGAAITAPENPSAIGYVFEGWYTDKECTAGHEYVFSMMPGESITVYAKWSIVTLSGIEITTAPTKTIYTEGERFDSTGMVITATYSDNSTKAVTNYTFSPDGALAITDTAVTVSYTEDSKTKTAIQAVTVNPVLVTLTKIEITTEPTKTVYTAGESFDATGMVVTATYSDSSTKDVTDYTFSPDGALTTADTAVTVSYTEGSETKTAEQPVTVNPAAAILTGISISKTPYKITYIEGELFDGTGMIVTATYSDGSSKAVSGYEITPSGALSVTDTTVEIRYTENGVTKTVKLIIQVNPAGPVVYKVIIGMNQTIFTNSDSAKFASDADFIKFDHVEVDGRTVAKKYYTSESGSTVITFNQAYIKTLQTGAHTLTIVSTDGSASTGFTVSAPLPPTGDSANPALLLTLLLASMGTVLLTSARARKRNEE